MSQLPLGGPDGVVTIGHERNLLKKKTISKISHNILGRKSK